MICNQTFEVEEIPMNSNLLTSGKNNQFDFEH